MIDVYDARGKLCEEPDDSYQPTIPALTDAERLVGHLTYTIEQILLYGSMPQASFDALAAAQKLALQCGRLVRQARGENE